jgi:GTPase SAR1 family protein
VRYYKLAKALKKMKKVMVEVDSSTFVSFAMPDGKAELRFKVLVLGDSRVGKSSLIQAFI